MSTKPVTIFGRVPLMPDTEAWIIERAVAEMKRRGEHADAAYWQVKLDELQAHLDEKEPK
jgi:hypothetical protein